MRKSLLYFLIIIINTAIVAETRVALVIGNSNYETWGKLKNTKNDARDMKNLLESRGFNVLYGTDLTRVEFEELLSEFRDRLAKNKKSIGLFYFSGHGMEIEHNNYLIPIDSKKPKRHLNISLERVIDDMSMANNRLNIIILDACRDNPFILARAFNAGGFSKINARRGLLIAYATEPGKVASDGNEELTNGLFTKYLLDYMKKPLPLHSVFWKTKNKVFQISNHKQLPTIDDQTVIDDQIVGEEDFFFTQPTQLKNKKREESDTSSSISRLSHIPLYCDYQDNDFD